MLDLILRNGTVFDGTEAEGFRADVGIQGEWIREIGDLSRTPARKVLDCTGLYVTPGFIEVPEREHHLDPHSERKLDKHPSRFEIIE